MKLQWAFLRSKVEQRLFWLFLSCAVVPILVLSILCFEHVTKQLYEQSLPRLHQASKAMGMSIAERIAGAEAELDAVMAAGDRGRFGDPPKHHFLSIQVMSRAGERSVWLGDTFEPPAIPASAEAHIRGGKALLSVAHPADSMPRVLLTKSIPSEGNGAVITGEIDSDRLFDDSGQYALPPMADFFILDENDRIIAGSRPGSDFLQTLRTNRPTSGQFEWKDENETQLAYYWSVFLKPNYHTPQWTVVVSEPEDEVLAPIASFRTTFPFAILLSVFVVALMCVSQIRRHLVPLKQLRDGTRRIAERDFDVDVSLDSSDEFQELADSFNAMARRLEEQFDSLTTMIDIDRSILSAIDREDVVNTLIAHLRDIYPCDSVAVSLIEPKVPSALRTQFSTNANAGSIVMEMAGLSAVEARQLGANPESLLIRLDRESPKYLEAHARAGMKLCLVLPLFVGQKPVGVVSLGHKSEEAHEAKRLAYARQLADQTATALSKVQTIEENRVLAYYDRLTGLPNRLLFKERLDQAVVAARRHSEHIAIFIFDIDAFKRINDTLGHDVGDILLRNVADRVSRFMPATSLARLGGDEFGALLTDLETFDDPARVARRILDVIAEPIELPQQEAFLMASIGIALYPDDGLDGDSLLRNADAAMYHAKHQGGNNFQYYTRAMNASAFRRLELENDLRRAIERDELRMYYQPFIDTGTRFPIGAEALLRWQHPRLGVIMPSEFIPLAEETGLIIELGTWALETACAQNRQWQEAGFPHHMLSVNLSSRQLTGEALIHTVRRALDVSGMHPQSLILELTESMMMNADEMTLQTLRGLKALGVQLSIDDFGTGYSSLIYLKNFPLDHLKIDRDFMAEVTRNENDAAIIRAIIAMAKSLDLHLVAEGIEFEAQMAFLQEHGCDAAQGYLISAPIPADAFTKWLDESLPE